VTVHYDPLVAKLIAAGRDRDEACDRMADALARYRIDGVKTTIPVHRRILASPAFRAGAVHTRFLEGGF
jgi:acetyl-CoA carboxylase biotin carboxylase subunit